MKTKKPLWLLARETVAAHRWLCLVTAAWFGFGAWFYLQAMQYRSDGWYFGHGNVWSDWSLHTSQVTRFVVAPVGEWWSTSLYYAGGQQTYPFLTNLLSALLIRGGWSYPAAMIGPSLVFWLATLLTLGWFGSWVLRSSKQAAVAITVFLTSAGFGLLRVLESPNVWPELVAPTRDYTQFVEYQWGTGNLFLGMFLPQRAFLLGFWLALLSWGVWLRTLESPWSGRVLKQSILAGILAGILPIAHMHSFMTLALLSAPLALRFARTDWRQSAVFAGVTALISVPLHLIFVQGGIENPEFFRVDLWWTSESFFAWIMQWIWQWGVTLPLAAVSLWSLHGRLSLVRWWALASFWGVFLLANLVQFQPTAWDNTKLFLWVYWGLSLALASYLASLWRSGRSGQLFAGMLFFFLVATGSFELLRSSYLEKYTYLATTQESYQLASQVRDQVPVNAVFATAPIHNHWVTMWAGRPIVMGYSAWVWNFGFLYQEREENLRQIFENPDQRAELLRKYNVSYLVVGPDERYYYPNLIEPAEYAVVFESSDTAVYDVSQSGD